MPKKNKTGLILLLILIAGGSFVYFKTKTASSKEVAREVSPARGSIETFISTAGNIQPQNRLEIKPPINGRVDKILVKEGQKVRSGEIIAWMSSTDRAALLDAAYSQGADAVQKWEEVYKPTPLIAPIDGEVIVSTTQPGQTVTSSDVVIVLSDHLIVQAQVDETDIGKVALDQTARITLDAYPAIKVEGRVDHIYYESKLVNNVTIYQVDVVPAEVSTVFRSGMSANVDIIQQKKNDVLTLPREAVNQGQKVGGPFVLLSHGKGEKPERRKVEVGISDDKNIEIISGVNEDDTVVIASPQYFTSKDNKRRQSSPFMPSRRR